MLGGGVSTVRARGAYNLLSHQLIASLDTLSSHVGFVEYISDMVPFLAPSAGVLMVKLELSDPLRTLLSYRLRLRDWSPDGFI
jgi:hypothetical protein